MKKTIGILAHVDAGKTTFSEQLLYYTGEIRTPGRVDYKTSYMDTDEIEQKRGITIFADQCYFTYMDDTYYLIDTPGHVDFSAETERAIGALDYAIVLISGSAGVQAHTKTLFRLLKNYKIPTFFFINKLDSEGFNLESTLEDIKNKLTQDVLYINSRNDLFLDKTAEFEADRDEALMELYLAGDLSNDEIKRSIINLIKSQQCFLTMSGSALKGVGIESFFEVFSGLTETQYTEASEVQSFSGKVYKIRHDEAGNRLTFIKALKGRLRVKDSFSFERDGQTFIEKVNEIRLYSGKKYSSTDMITAGDVFAVTGLQTPVCGAFLQSGTVSRETAEEYYISSVLKSRIKIIDGTNNTLCMEKLRILEAEDPMLSISFNRETEEILVSVMGRIQLEVLEQHILTRFGIKVSFERPQVQYRETIAAPVVGYGHFEPLRHYAEVQLRLEPAPRGKGITFQSECHVDTLDISFQRLIETHIFERQHKGVLTGSPITDINIVLQSGRAHIKHTSGGDFREATYRAVRQGLEKAESVLLEPFYQFEIYADETYIGRIMSDIQKRRGTFEPPAQTGDNICVVGKGPVESFMEYSLELISFTKGRGSMSLFFSGYDICGNAGEVILKTGYQKERDIENTSSSVFCAKGTSFVVTWDEAEQYMHTI